MVVAVLHTPVHRSTPPARLGRALGYLTLGIGLMCAVAVWLPGPAHRLELLPLGIALQSVRLGGTIALGAAGLALVAVLLTLGSSSRSRWRRRARWALLINLAVAAWPLYMLYQGQTLPKIHDISTDTANPPTFDAVLPLRRGAKNPADYVAATGAEQRKGYPDIVPLQLPLAPAVVFDNAERAARAMGWQVVDASPAKLRIEAIDTTPVFGFKDDIVVRITPQGSGSVVDVRSLSRVGSSDLGANAKRVRAYLQRVATASGAS
ncbi:MAG: DUF1499 domain-containing protein [Burkholderiaceae bacterium]|nr:DUF1499 domain-containing protein [Burkholderiaceae bacterium]